MKTGDLGLVKMESSLFTLEKGMAADSEGVYLVHTAAIKQLCSSHYSEKQISTWAGKQRKETYIPYLESENIIVAKKNGIVVGFVHHMENISENNSYNTSNLSSEIPEQGSNIELEIKGLFVHPSCVRNGLGKLLVKEIEQIALNRAVTVMKVSASLNSLPFYVKMGFEEVGRTPHQISCQCSVECVSMVKRLIKE